MMSITSYVRKPLKWLILTLVLGGFFLVTPVMASPPFEDNFDTYIVNTKLGGQGNWVCPYDEFWVNDITADTEPYSIVNWSGYGGVCRKDGEAKISGDFSFWIKTVSCSYSDNTWALYLQKNVDTLITFEGLQTGDICRIRISGPETGYIEIEIPDNYFENWSRLQTQWKVEETISYFRYKIKNEDWSSWIKLQFSIDTGIDRIYMNSVDRNGSIYFDTFGEIQEICELGNCNVCETYYTCMNAGCYWYYSIYLQKSFCVEPYEPDPEECGSFYKCQYCSTQETCEAELNCEWKDIGFGDKCYMKEPEIPPEQVSWEVPELENCDELSGVEKWLCEIKNFIAGIFMPSQEKVNALYQTIGAFKEKFPFNYINEFGLFYDDLKIGVSETEDITISILGSESNVSFAFWEKTATIGGINQSFKDIIRLFTTGVLLIAWTGWLISFIKRIF